MFEVGEISTRTVDVTGYVNGAARNPNEWLACFAVSVVSGLQRQLLDWAEGCATRLPCMRVLRALVVQSRAVDIRELVNDVNVTCNMFPAKRQCDASEFLQFLYMAVNNEEINEEMTDFTLGMGLAKNYFKQLLNGNRGDRPSLPDETWEEILSYFPWPNISRQFNRSLVGHMELTPINQLQLHGGRARRDDDELMIDSLRVMLLENGQISPCILDIYPGDPTTDAPPRLYSFSS